MNLNLLEIDSVGTSGHGKLVTVTSAVLAIGSWEVIILGPVLLQEGIFGEVGSVATSGKDNGTVGLVGVSAVGVFDTNDSASLILEKFCDASLLDDLHPVGVTDGEILQSLHLGVGDNLGAPYYLRLTETLDCITHHSRELSITAVSTGLAVSAETGNLGKVELELVLQPVNGVTRLVGEHTDQVIASEITSLDRKLGCEEGLSGSRMHTDFFVSAKKVSAESGIFNERWELVPAPLIPDVALVELPPMKLDTYELLERICL